jgi:hypothetical protein
VLFTIVESADLGNPNHLEAVLKPHGELKISCHRQYFCVRKTLESAIRIIAGGNSMVSADPDYTPERIEGGSK